MQAELNNFSMSWKGNFHVYRNDTLCLTGNKFSRGTCNDCVKWIEFKLPQLSDFLSDYWLL